jgi:hypothetical protein
MMFFLLSKVGFEPNPAHTPLLVSIESAFREFFVITFFFKSKGQSLKNVCAIMAYDGIIGINHTVK